MKTALQYTTDIIAIQSHSGDEDAIAQHIYKVTKKWGTVQQIGKSVVLHIVGQNRQKAFILNGHTDTVPDSPQWATDPYTAYTKDDKLYGLGASDMKSGVGIMLALAEQNAHTQPLCDMWFMFVEQEETDGRGTKAVLDTMPDFNQAYPEGVEGIILEPTDATHYGIGHKGNVFVQLTFKGAGGHGSVALPYTNRASYKAAHFIAKLSALQKIWQQDYTHKILGSPTINVTDLASLGSAAFNAVPQEVVVTLDIRTSPLLATHFEKELNMLAKKYDFSYNYPYNPSGYGLCPESSVLLSYVRSTVPSHTITVFQGATDQLFFTEKNIPMLIYGPGCNAVMHQPNEYVEITAIQKATTTIQKLITQFASTI
jgi:acetylornithine deacetylase/succinyl-diaminopimelate desuccinylase-like protein